MSYTAMSCPVVSYRYCFKLIAYFWLCLVMCLPAGLLAETATETIAGTGLKNFPSQSTGTIRIAVASNFKSVLQQVVTQYEKSHPARILISAASTGILYTQIIHGAPFDIFLAADNQRPKLLENNNRIMPDSRFTYAIGSLVLAANKKTLIEDHKSYLAFINNAQRLAIASPITAPYGLATQQALKRDQLWSTLKKKFITGKNISQAHQFIDSGNVDAGFIAYSQLQLPGNKSHLLWSIPSNSHSPIIQQAVLLKKSAANPSAIDFYQFLQSTISRSIIASNGYLLPKAETPVLKIPAEGATNGHL